MELPIMIHCNLNILDTSKDNASIQLGTSSAAEKGFLPNENGKYTFTDSVAIYSESHTGEKLLTHASIDYSYTNKGVF